MKAQTWWLIMGAALLVAAPPLQRVLWAQDDGEAAAARFTWVDVYVDAGELPLAAYQVDLVALTDDVRIVGVEGGDTGAFAEPPYYDPAALQQGHIILGAFDTGDELPVGPVRVARLHVMCAAGAAPEMSIELTVAATLGGDAIDATAWVEQGE